MLGNAKFKVFIPSYKRWDTIKKSVVNKMAPYVDVSVVALSEDEANYRRVLSNEVKFIPVDKSSEGRLAKKRNWILDNCFTKDLDFIVMMDDDVEGIYFMLGENPERISEENYGQIFEETYLLAETVGAPAFGFSNTINIRNMIGKRMNPISFHSLFSEVCIGFLDRGFRYDEKVNIRVDVELLCRMLYQKGILCKNGFYGIREIVTYGAGSGGLRESSNKKFLEDDNKYIIKKYGLFAKRFIDLMKGSFYK